MLCRSKGQKGIGESLKWALGNVFFFFFWIARSQKSNFWRTKFTALTIANIWRTWRMILPCQKDSCLRLPSAEPLHHRANYGKAFLVLFVSAMLLLLNSYRHWIWPRGLGQQFILHCHYYFFSVLFFACTLCLGYLLGSEDSSQVAHSLVRKIRHVR